MLEAQGIVVALDRAQGLAWVETQASTACGGCQTESCGTGAVTRFLSRRTRRIQVLNPLQAQVGERVRIGLAESALLQGALWVYLAPLLTFFIAASAMQWWLGTGHEGIVTLAGLSGLALGLSAAYYAQRRQVTRQPAHQPTIIACLPTLPFA